MSAKNSAPQELNVSAIRNGTVIDHIRNEVTFKVVEILNLMQEERMVLIGVNLPSDRLGRKGLIKIEDREVTPAEVNRIALIAPDATVNIIKDYGVVEKRKVEAPDRVEGMLLCANPNCVTNQQGVETCFDVMHSTPPTIRCTYCERIMSGRDIVVK